MADEIATEEVGVIDVEALSGTTLWLMFSDRTERIVDLRPFLTGPMFEELLDVTKFREVHVDHELGTIVWPNEVNIAPEVLRYDYDRLS